MLAGTAAVSGSGARWIAPRLVVSIPRPRRKRARTMIRVLIADDEADLRETLRTLLESEGYSVSEATDGRAALEAVRASSEPLVVLLDVVMPRLNGIQVLDAIAADDALAERNASLLLTANHRPMLDAAAGLLAQLDVVVVRKPFDIDALVTDVARCAARLR